MTNGGVLASVMMSEGNPIVESLLVFGVVIVMGMIVRFFLTHYLEDLMNRLTKPKQKVSFSSGINLPLVVILAIYFSVQTLPLPELFLDGSFVILVFAILRSFAVFINQFVKFLIHRDGSTLDQAKQDAFVLVARMLKFLSWIVAFLVILSRFGIDINSLLAGLGIGGIAVALAAQNLLGDLFSSLAIVLDKPFNVGDLVAVGEYRGSVMKVGIKTTRIKSSTGEEIVIPNSQVAAQTLLNLRRRKHRKVELSLMLKIGSNIEKIEGLKSQVEEILNKYPKVSITKILLTDITPSGYVFDIAYLFKSSDFELYKETRHQVNLEILKLLKAEKLEIAPMSLAQSQK